MSEVPNWFDQPALGMFTARAQFERHLLPAQPLHCVQVGVFTGDASVWLLENVPGCTLDDVDIWTPDDYFGVLGTEAERIHDERVTPFGDRARKFKMTAWEYFALNRPQADFIYIDGDHFAVSVIEDAVCAWRQLKVGGIMAFDDYSDLGSEFEHPHLAVDAFVSIYANRVEVLSRATQVWLRKVAA